MPKKQTPQFEDVYFDDEIAQRRDEVVRRMANTQPQPKPKSLLRQRKKKKVVADRAAGRGRAVHES